MKTEKKICHWCNKEIKKDERYGIQSFTGRYFHLGECFEAYKKSEGLS